MVGSSQFGKKGTKATKIRLENPSGFAPLERFKHWGRRRHRRFNWIAGRELRTLGYEVPDLGGGVHFAIYNVMLDIFSMIRHLLRTGFRLFRKSAAPLKRRAQAMVSNV